MSVKTWPETAYRNFYIVENGPAEKCRVDVLMPDDMLFNPGVFQYIASHGSSVIT